MDFYGLPTQSKRYHTRTKAIDLKLRDDDIEDHELINQVLQQMDHQYEVENETKQKYTNNRYTGSRLFTPSETSMSTILA